MVGKGSASTRSEMEMTITCPVRALARRVIHVRNNTTDWRTTLSAIFDQCNTRYDVTDKDIRTQHEIRGEKCFNIPS